jgi:hypothetical protein
MFGCGNVAPLGFFVFERFDFLGLVAGLAWRHEYLLIKALIKV